VPNRNEVVAEHRSRHPSEERRERRLIGVPPGEVVAKKPEIQLIAVIAVARRGDEENRGQSRRNRADPPPGHRLELGATPSLRQYCRHSPHCNTYDGETPAGGEQTTKARRTLVSR
jgi:hypothetical protein